MPQAGSGLPAKSPPLLADGLFKFSFHKRQLYTISSILKGEHGPDGNGDAQQIQVEAPWTMGLPGQRGRVIYNCGLRPKTRTTLPEA